MLRRQEDRRLKQATMTYRSKSMMKILIAFIVFGLQAIGQQTVDNSGASRVTPWPVRDSFPGTCSYGDHMTYSQGTIGANDYVCGSSNDWHQSSGSGGSISAATSSTLGSIKTTGDLAGTGNAPTVAGIQGKPVSSTAPTDGQLLGYSASAGQWLPLSLAQRLDPRPIRTVGLKPPNDASATVTAGSTVTLASLTGPGTLEQIQFATASTGYPTPCGSGNPNGLSLDSTFTITVDGTAVVTGVSLGTLFGLYGYDSTTSIVPYWYANSNRTVDNYISGAGEGVKRRQFIQFASSLSITWTNTSGCSALVYSGIDWRPGTPPVGLYSPYYNKIHMVYTPFGSGSVAGTVGTAFSPLPSVTPGSSGLLDSIDVFILGQTSNPTWLEGHPCVVVDGVCGASQKGTEDFFNGHFYFVHAVQSDEAGPTFVGLCNSAGCNSNYYTGMYRYFHNQPCIFNTSLAVNMENGHVSESPSVPAITYASLVVYYTVN